MSPWTEQNKKTRRKSSIDGVDADAALRSLERWLEEEQSNLPRFDQATLYSGWVI